MSPLSHNPVYDIGFPIRRRPPSFAFWMLATTPHGDGFTLSDYDAMARDAGFSGVTGRRVLPTPETLVEFKR